MASATAAGSAYSTHGEHDDPVLHLLLDVRLPAHRRLDLGDGRPAGARLPDRRHRRPDHADRRGPPARRRPLAAAGGDQPGGRALRPGVRLRGRPHRAARPRPDVRLQRGAPARRGRHLLPHRLQRAVVQPGRARETSTSRACSRGIHHVATPLEGCPTTPRASSCSPAASGFPWIHEAQQLLADDWGVGRRPLVGHLLERAGPRRASPPRSGTCCTPARSRVRRTSPTSCGDAPGPVVAVSDYMRAVPLQIARWVPQRLPRARRRRLRLRRHPPGRPPLLPHRRRVGRRPGPRRRSPTRARSPATRSRRRSTTTASTTRPPSPASSRRAATPDPSAVEPVDARRPCRARRADRDGSTRSLRRGSTTVTQRR